MWYPPNVTIARLFMSKDTQYIGVVTGIGVEGVVE